jgi:uncharacterized membrane protein YkoI
LIVVALVGLSLSLPLDARDRRDGHWQAQQAYPYQQLARGPEDRGNRKQYEDRRKGSDKRGYRDWKKSEDRRGGSDKQYSRDRRSYDGRRKASDNRNNGDRRQYENRRQGSDKRYSEGRDRRGGRQQEKGGRQSLDSAVSNARKRTGGRVVSAETKNLDGREVHYIRILSDDGKVKRLRVDARTGRPISSRKR